MFLIVEGCDKSGKTTLIKNLEKMFPIEYVKFDRRPKDSSPQEQQRIRDGYETTIAIYSMPQYHNKLIVLDRFYPSEVVYCFKRNYDVFDNEWFYKTLEAKIKQLPHVLIYLDTPANVIYDRLKVTEDDYIKENEISIIIARYNKFLETKTTLNYIRLSGLNSSYENIKQLFEFMIKANSNIFDK
jgi:thymidylate kinase